MSSMIIKMQSRRATQGFTLVEVMVSMAVIAIVSVMVVSAFTTAANLKNKDTESRYDAAGTENLIATETEPNESLGVDLVVGDYAIEGGINSYTDGSRTYTMFDEGAGAVARPMVVDADFDDEGNPRTTSGASGIYNVVKTGKYKLEVWGAQGGDCVNLGGKGGYSVGTVILTKDTTVYLYAGGKPNGIAGGYNGGGHVSSTFNTPICVGGGGGSDVRINNDNYSSRVIVAGGGGGGKRTVNYVAGYGGGIIGGNGEHANATYNAGGGTQIAAGAVAYPGGTLDLPTTNGYNRAGFGFGGNSLNLSIDAAGGGGGWYGGGAANGSGCTSGGGSGWIYTASAFNTWQAGNPSDASSYLLTPEYYLTDAQTIAGNVVNGIPDPYSWDSTTKTYLSNITGKTGGGFVRITWAGRA